MAEYKIVENLLTINPYSRPNIKLKGIKGIVIHWVANRNSTALANRNFFERRKNGAGGYGSAHEIIDLNGDVLVCIPDNEMAYHVGSPNPYTSEAIRLLSAYPNDCTYGIECTHVEYDGTMDDRTYNTLIARCADLIKKFGLEKAEKPLWLHQEVVGWKDCHRWFVNNPEEWRMFRNRVMKEVNRLNLKEQWQWDMLLKTVENLEKKKVLTSSVWRDKVQKKDLTADELAWLCFISLDRLTD